MCKIRVKQGGPWHVSTLLADICNMIGMKPLQLRNRNNDHAACGSRLRYGGRHKICEHMWVLDMVSAATFSKSEHLP